MCRRKRSRPSSRRRETKNVKRLRPACVGCTSATGVVEEQRFTTKRGLEGGGAKMLPEDGLCAIGLVACCIQASFMDGNPAIPVFTWDRRLCVPVFRQVCESKNVTKFGTVTRRVKLAYGETVHNCRIQAK